MYEDYDFMPASFLQRLGAILLDGLVVAIPVGIIGAIFGTPTFARDFVFFLYELMTPVLWRGYVVGKRIVGIRIVRIDGKDVHLGNMIMRNVVGGIVYLITFGLGIIVSICMVVLREDRRSIHDLIGGTMVVESYEDR